MTTRYERLGTPVLVGGCIGTFDRETVEVSPVALACDRIGDFGAVLFVEHRRDRRSPGWWGVAVCYRFFEGAWREISEDDNVWADDPFSRPPSVDGQWVDWHSPGSISTFADGRETSSFYGAARIGTNRLCLQYAGQTRDLAISPSTGAYIGFALAAHWKLVGFGDRGELGRLCA